MQVLPEQQPVGQLVLSQLPPKHAPSLQTPPAEQVRHCAPLSPQLVAFCALVGMHTVPAQQPLRQLFALQLALPPPVLPPPPPPPPAPPPVDPPSSREPGTHTLARQRQPLPHSESVSHCCSSTGAKQAATGSRTRTAKASELRMDTQWAGSAGLFRAAP